MDKYFDRREDPDQMAPLLFITAKRLAIKLINQKSKRKSLLDPDYPLAQGCKCQNPHDKNREERKNLQDDISCLFDILKEKNKSYVFILDKFIQLEYYEDKSHEEVVKIIAAEYFYQFSKVLTVDNYRTIKKRASRKFKKLWLSDI
ncbi:MAG: hypothetical protein HC880_19415 [Bacteroidia bacterium]|nr:hypothetical protein [Bacteroidia bacterium]